MVYWRQKSPVAPGRRSLSHGVPALGAMPPLPRVTGREVVRALGKLGWEAVIQKGAHAQLKHPTRGGRVTVPLHAGDPVPDEVGTPELMAAVTVAARGRSAGPAQEEPDNRAVIEAAVAPA